MRRLLVLLGRIRVRLLAVNLLALFVPAIGLEFARIHERELLDALERDMSNQAVLVRSFVEQDLVAGRALGAPEHEKILATAAQRTRTRIRLVDKDGEVRADSHAEGPPEGPEPPPHVPRARRPASSGRRSRSASRCARRSRARRPHARASATATRA
ncbi:MAG TPA: hypothetical protein VM694_09790 [Polyangium sp.]|nr:hypothetical protein [Polyangium sp.]